MIVWCELNNKSIEGFPYKLIPTARRSQDFQSIFLWMQFKEVNLLFLKNEMLMRF